MFKQKLKNGKWFSKKIEVKESTVDKEGLGVFATEFIKKYEIFESAPVLVWHMDLLNDYMRLHQAGHLLSDHVFVWEKSSHALCLGYGTIYNHSNEPNSKHRRVFDKNHPRIEFIALKDIQPGEEIFHHYAPKKGDLFFTDGGTFDYEGVIDSNEFRKVNS
ncbi:MAG: SET domain-containing protein-lysine N-methyltransferase [Euryarchaeota archaeon]|nr:SET domain-containing protein-lysine N-methyltransferase [Euryarchaeota archaeon]MBJ84963.1 SET domain-containing protein-lysine N-methyltransferase [Euryarchaeota archaeon]|tara:strand:- start:338 stop:820 length:483 start_codon:yes stop_codon:yes gene_type:complete